MTTYGNITSGVYPLGTITVAASGTPVALNTNVPTDTGFGYTATSAPMTCAQLLFGAWGTNTDVIYVCFKGGDKTTPNSFLCVPLQPGQSFNLGTGILTNIFQPKLIVIDSAVSGDKCQVTAIVL